MQMTITKARAYYAPPDGNDIPTFQPGSARAIHWLGPKTIGDFLLAALSGESPKPLNKRRIFIAVTFAGSGETIYDWPAIERMDGPAS